jgi:hypothetical protein
VTGRDLVSASLRLIGALAPTESPAAAEATDGLAALNRMIDSWSTESLLIYAYTAETALTLTPGDATYTMGASGDITTRPMSIEKAVIRDDSVSPALDFPVQLLSLEEYAALSAKTTQTTYPYALYDDGGYPQRTLTLYPVPSAAKKLVLFTLRPLTTITTLDTSISLPPGYEEALVYNGAIRLAPSYGKATPAEVAAIASESKANIKRANYKPRYLRIEGIPADSRGTFDIMTGGYR